MTKKETVLTWWSFFYIEKTLSVLWVWDHLGDKWRIRIGKYVGRTGGEAS